MEGLQLTFSKSDSIHEAYKTENEMLKEEVVHLKARIESIEEMLEQQQLDKQGEEQSKLILSFDDNSGNQVPDSADEDCSDDPIQELACIFCGLTCDGCIGGDRFAPYEEA